MQTQTDTLRDCVADHTSGRDRKDLAIWIFLAMAAHPEIKQYAGANVPTATEESARTLGSLVMRLMTESCATEVKALLKSGTGAQAVVVAFSRLGELAMRELMADKSVQETMSLFERYLDRERFDKLRASP